MNETFKTSDEVRFMRGLDKTQLRLYWGALRRRKFGAEINRRMVMNQTIRRMKELALTSVVLGAVLIPMGSVGLAEEDKTQEELVYELEHPAHVQFYEEQAAEAEAQYRYDEQMRVQERIADSMEGLEMEALEPCPEPPLLR